MFAGLLVAAGLVGCSADSAETPTGKITADILVSTGDGTSVSYEVHLKTGRKDVDLTGDDTVVGETSQLRTTLEKSKFLGQTVYRGMIYTEGDDRFPAGEEVTVRLDRGGDGDAPASIVVLPEVVTIAAPADGENVSRAEPLRIDVDDAPGGVQVSWTGTCLAADATVLSFAPGEPVVVPAGSLRPVDSGSASATCAATLYVARVQTGSLDAGFEGGSIRAERRASVQVTSTP